MRVQNVIGVNRFMKLWTEPGLLFPLDSRLYAKLV